MKITVCELPDQRKPFDTAWGDLVDHVRAENSDLVVLPDMPFSSWFANSDRFDREVWAAAVRSHDEWEHRLRELSPAIVMGSRPVDFGNERYDEGFLWEEPLGMLSVHAKSFLPDVQGAREGSWYDSATAEFVPVEVRGLRIAMLIGSEMWAPRGYEAEHVDVLAIPRAGDMAALGDGVQRACALARHAHAFSVSSNRSGPFGGLGWIISPEAQVLGQTSADEPFLSLEVALHVTKGEMRHFDVFAH
jgi:N-carbamoylputrescine amidase